MGALGPSTHVEDMEEAPGFRLLASDWCNLGRNEEIGGLSLCVSSVYLTFQ